MCLWKEENIHLKKIECISDTPDAEVLLKLTKKKKKESINLQDRVLLLTIHNFLRESNKKEFIKKILLLDTLVYKRNTKQRRK